MGRKWEGMSHVWEVGDHLEDLGVDGSIKINLQETG
jgi:hypothetical protein